MSSPVVSSYSVTTASTAPITITKPTGLAVGDLLLAIVAVGNSADSAIHVATPSGWSLIGLYPPTSYYTQPHTGSLYKIADSTDVAATNFTFTAVGLSGGEVMNGVLMRITNFDQYTPVQGFSTSTTSTVSLTPTFADSLIFAAISTDATASNTTSGYTSTGSPTWTELIDDHLDNGVLAAVYASYPSTTTITSFNFSSTGATNLLRALFAIRPIVDGNGAFTTQPISVTDNGSTVSTSTTATQTTQQIDATTNADATVIYDRINTVWSNTSKPSTTWNNTSKP